jgi:hypothetical protein
MSDQPPAPSRSGLPCLTLSLRIEIRTAGTPRKARQGKARQSKKKKRKEKKKDGVLSTGGSTPRLVPQKSKNTVSASPCTWISKR